MGQPIATITELKVELVYKSTGIKTVDTHSFGSPKGAQKFVDEILEKDIVTVNWYVIETNQYFLCHEDDPDGKTYITPSYTKFWFKDDQLKESENAKAFK